MVAVIGDSTFFHTGIPALVNVVYNQANILVIIIDNRITGMTGHQENPGTGMTLQSQPTEMIELEPLVRALGIKHVATVHSYDVAEIEKTFKELMATNEPAVMIAREDCALLPEMRRQYVPLEVIEEKCNGCSVCFRIGCPAILKSDEVDAKSGKPLAIIDHDLCTGCEICSQLCPHDAITQPRPDAPPRGGRRGDARCRRRGGADHGPDNTVNFVLVGVGGQGTLLASNILADVGLAAGLDVKKSEVHGMSQRGGSVVSHVRWHPERVSSPLVGLGEADILLAFEKLEALRFVEFLKAGRHRGGQRDGDRADHRLGGHRRVPRGRRPRPGAGGVWALARSESPARGSRRRPGNAKAANVVLLGAVSRLLTLPEELWWTCLEQRVPKKFLELNRVAFASGRACVS